MHQPLTSLQFSDLAYTDFVGYVNQTNVPPGAYSTINQWAVFSRLSPESRILEVACTSGFSIRELVRFSGVSGVGFDLSHKAVKAAQNNASTLGSRSDRLAFVQADGYQFESAERFSHVVVGAALGFFPDQEKMLQKITSHMNDRAYLLASPFYCVREMPSDIVEAARKVLGITPTLKPYKDVLRVFKGLDVLYENRCAIECETAEEIEHYCQSTIERFAKEKSVADERALEVAFARLKQIRDVTNALRPYQGYSVMVLGFDRATYPARYVELF